MALWRSSSGGVMALAQVWAATCSFTGASWAVRKFLRSLMMPLGNGPVPATAELPHTRQAMVLSIAVLGYAAAVPFGHVLLTSGATVMVWLMSCKHPPSATFPFW